MVGQHMNIISLLGCCTQGGKKNLRFLLRNSPIFPLGQVMLIVEYAKYGNLRDYLRRKRPPGHVLSGSFEHDENDESYKHDDNDELIRSLTTIDLIVFSLQVASGMEYLHSKKVTVFFEYLQKSYLHSEIFSASIVISLLETFYWLKIVFVK